MKTDWSASETPPRALPPHGLLHLRSGSHADAALLLLLPDSDHDAGPHPDASPHACCDAYAHSYSHGYAFPRARSRLHAGEPSRSLRAVSSGRPAPRNPE